MAANFSFKAVVIGTSAGGLDALTRIIGKLPADFPAALLIVQHLPAQSDDFLERYLQAHSQLVAAPVHPGLLIEGGVIYCAPANYHMLVEQDRTLSLSIEAYIQYSRPSIDVLFESAADAYQRQLIGLILTGANCDGSFGLNRVHHRGGVTIVQSPDSAEYQEMPESAIQATPVDHVLPLDQIATLLTELVCG